MHFEIDKQTIKDLNIYSDSVEVKSIAGLFDHTKSVYGKSRIYELLGSPLADYEELKERTDTIRFFYNNSLFDLQLDGDALGFAQYYQKQRRSTLEPTFATAFWRKIFDKLNSDAQYFLMESGVQSTVELLKWLHHFGERLIKINKEKNIEIPQTLINHSEKIREIFLRNGYDKLIKQKSVNKTYQIGKLDYQFRIKDRRDILYCLDLIYEYDAFSTIARVANERGFTFADLCKAEDSIIDIKDLHHPLLDKAIANDISLDGSSNVLFLSGPNMAGKSTLLKSLAIAVFLAHVGFPVPASYLNISVLSGISTAINIADDLSSGYSHFYAEVMRIKQVAMTMKEHKNMLVIFDELFRGTNVKDAYDGTTAVIKAFSEINSTFFVMSTHIVEVAEELKDINNVKFNYLSIDQQDGHPVYSYKVKDGISKDRLGLYIIEQEGLIDLINNIKEK